MSNARTRSPFGKFQLSQSHLQTGTDPPEQPLPRVTEMARMIREDGKTIEEIAAMCDRSPSTIRQKLSTAGFLSSTGQPKR